MNHLILDKIEMEQYRKQPLAFAVGDSVKVHTKVVEGDKERIQIFAGVVIGRRGHGLNSTFTVRRISYGEGVERVFPEHSPRVEKVEVERKGSVRRAKLTYLRDRIGKGATLVKEKEGRVVKGKTAAAASAPAPVAALLLPRPLNRRRRKSSRVIRCANPEGIESFPVGGLRMIPFMTEIKLRHNWEAWRGCVIRTKSWGAISKGSVEIEMLVKVVPPEERLPLPRWT